MYLAVLFKIVCLKPFCNNNPGTEINLGKSFNCLLPFRFEGKPHSIFGSVLFQ